MERSDKLIKLPAVRIKLPLSLCQAAAKSPASCAKAARRHYGHLTPSSNCIQGSWNQISKSELDLILQTFLAPKPSWWDAMEGPPELKEKVWVYTSTSSDIPWHIKTSQPPVFPCSSDRSILSTQPNSTSVSTLILLSSWS